MNNISLENLSVEKKNLKSIITTCNKALGKAPIGNLWVSSCKGKIKFYHHVPKTSYSEGKKIYLNRSHFSLTRELAQKDYDRKLLSSAEKKLSAITAMQEAYSVPLEKVYAKECKEKQSLITPRVKTYAIEKEEWMCESYVGKKIPDSQPILLTARNEKVRSKSEKIIADLFHKYDLAYRYEAPIIIDGVGLFHPDFAILSPITRKVVLWEHFGLMDDINYSRNAIEKINIYELAGYRLGIDIIYTFETRDCPINSEVVEALILSHFF